MKLQRERGKADILWDCFPGLTASAKPTCPRHCYPMHGLLMLPKNPILKGLSPPELAAATALELCCVCVGK